jgi:hypothetical protein
MMRLLALSAAAVLLAACGEQPQQIGEASKSGKYAGKGDTTPYSGEKFKGNRAEWERTLRARADNQNEYKRTQ